MHAREVAASEIDEIKGRDFGAIGIDGAADTFMDAANNEQVAPESGYAGISSGPETVTTPSGQSYSVIRDVRKYVNSSYSNTAATKKVTVVVSWTGPGSPSSEMMQTFIGPTGNEL